MSAPERMIFIVPSAAGGVRVSGAGTGALIAELDQESAGFIAGLDGVLARERTQHGLDRALPVRLLRWQDGRLNLLDPATGWRAELVGLGSTLHAHVRFNESSAVYPGDEVLVHGAPVVAPYGQVVVEHRSATITRATGPSASGPG